MLNLACPFTNLMASHIFTDAVCSRFTAWCTKYGVQLNTWAVPYVQLGPVPYQTFTFPSYSLKSMSIAKRYTIYGPTDLMP